MVIIDSTQLPARIQTSASRRSSSLPLRHSANGLRLESTANFTPSVTWNQEWRGTLLTNLFQTFDVSTTNQTIFCRALQE